MKAKWEDSKAVDMYKRKKRIQLWGIYHKKGLFRRRLICYFLSRNEARETCKKLDRRFSVSTARL
jgi:hypothetical protein